MTSFFPARDYDFASYPFDRDPWEYVKKIESWAEKPIQLTITKTNINAQFMINSFNPGEPDGSGDIEYSLSMTEYRPPTYTKPQKATPTAPKKAEPIKENTAARPVKPTPKTHVVKSGECLSVIAKKYYGSGSQQTKIYNANKSVIESTAKKHGYTSSSNKGIPGWWIFPGTKLVIP